MHWPISFQSFITMRLMSLYEPSLRVVVGFYIAFSAVYQVYLSSLYMYYLKRWSQPLFLLYNTIAYATTWEHTALLKIDLTEPNSHPQYVTETFILSLHVLFKVIFSPQVLEIQPRHKLRQVMIYKLHLFIKLCNLYTKIN